MSWRQSLKLSPSKIVSTIILQLLSSFFLLFSDIFRLSFMLILFCSLILTNYCVSCLVFDNFKLTKLFYYLMYPVFTIALFILMPAAQYIGLSDCYTTNGYISNYAGIPYKECKCTGSLVGHCPLFMICDFHFRISCFGIITGSKYVYQGKEFHNISEWKNYCKNFKEYNEDKQHCYKALNEVKEAEIKSAKNR